MGRHGRKRQLELESQYWALLRAGVGTVAACRAVGITRKTGYRWRTASGGVLPVVLDEDCRSSRYLSLLERQRIATLRAQGLSVRAIAEELGRSPSTISRELRRNTAAHDRGRYDGDLAHARARQRARRPRRARISQDPELQSLIQQQLELEWSPEQIAAWLRRTYPDRVVWHVCHETIYQALYHGGKGGLSRTLTKRLRTGRPLRKRRRRPDSRQERSVRFVAPAFLIGRRPAVVDDRCRLGDWEGDLIVGARSKSAIGTLVERRSRLLRLIHLPDGHSAADLLTGIVPLLQALPAAARLTLTWDQGSEMARHDQLADHFADGVYFATPASPWLRGTNENTNGLLRQYFPKGTDLATATAEDLAAVEDRLNHRPRKILGWKTPHEVFTAELAAMPD